ncbi:MAG: UDP-2,3-diacylglucosamine diphosphatase [Calditrichaceae bacterium]|nr:UDP-2,3-diacylglucosamine diphosphatase [Calditrichaceae bacterium]MBN2710446.1 UDP-2,3-diacylglucosamine diphosphatase [Calditrichaceae bacterium]RQV93618.1 MAG: UDP-2,3-diacylglucosamine diphosphatase [Calditrichota bacterium]
MIKAYFISDLHIGAEANSKEQERQKKILHFLEMIAIDASHLCIVGDLFDFWFEYKYVVPKKYFDFLYVLKKLVQSGVEIHYLTGNHDFYLGHFLDEYIGIKTWPNDCKLEIGGKKFYLFHGDGVASRDVGYRILKKILRNKLNLKLYRWLHPDLGIPFARVISGSSRKYTKKKNLQDEMDYKNFAESRFREGFDYVLMGHRHMPLEHKVGNSKYINLGDWLDNFTYAVFDGIDLELKYYNRE